MAVFAADHGVHAQGVTPWPQEVTAQMVANFLAGGAVVNAFAAEVGAEVVVVDVGVAGPLDPAPGLMDRKVRPGTADLAEGPAMTVDEARRAVEVGIEVATRMAPGSGSLVTGDMGIGNTTASAALVCAFTGAAPEAATGRGTGVDDRTWERKVAVVARARPAGAGAAVDPARRRWPRWPRSAGSSTPRWPGSSSARPRTGPRCSSTAPSPGRPRSWPPRCARPRWSTPWPGTCRTRPGTRSRCGTSGCVRCWGWTSASARGPARSWRCRWSTGAARALRDVATFDSAGVTQKSD